MIYNDEGTVEEEPKKNLVLSNETYDVLKWVTQVALPGIGALYFGLAGIWGLPYAEQIAGTVTVLVTFLGVILQISSANYNASRK